MDRQKQEILMDLLKESFEEFKLNEIGEGVKPYRYQGPNKKQILSKLDYEFERRKPEQWSDDAKLTWTFKGDKGYYTAEITFSVKSLTNLNPFLIRKKNPNLKPSKTRQITGNIGFFETRGKDKERTTDFGEQFSVLSTVSEIVVEFFNSIMDEYKIDTFYMIPKADKGETEAVDNRRGKFYEAYIRKQIKRVKEPITVEPVDNIKTNDGGTVGGFVLRGGHWSSGSREFIKNESLDEGLTSSIKTALSKGKETFDKIKDGVRRESKETKEVIKLLRRANSGSPLTMKEKEFIRAQVIDLVKTLPIIAISGIPAPIPITPFLILLGKKIGFNILPDSHIKTDYKINEEKGKTLFHPGSGDAIQGTGYADKAAADRTIKIIDKLKKTDHRHAMSIATTMENRAKTHKHQTPDMKEAAKIFRAWIDKNKKG